MILRGSFLKNRNFFHHHEGGKLKMIFSQSPIFRFSKEIPNQSEFQELEQKKTSALAETEFTEFQKTFGFHEDIAEMQKQNQKREKRKYIQYSIGALVSVGVLTSVFLITMDPAIEKSVKQAYFVHSTNLKLKKTALLNTRSSSQKKIRYIQEFFQNMKANELTQPTYTLILLEEIQQILSRQLVILADKQEILREIPSLLSEIHEIMIKFKRFPLIQEKYIKTLERIADTIILHRIQHEKGDEQEGDKALFILNSGIHSDFLVKVSLFGFLFESSNLKQKNSFIQLLKLISIKQLSDSELKELVNTGFKIANEIVELGKVQSTVAVNNQIDPNSKVSFEEFQVFQKWNDLKLSRSILFTMVPLIDALDANHKQALINEINLLNDVINQLE